MNIAEILKRKGIIKRSPEEIQAIANRASNKVQSPLDSSIPLPPIPDKLKWVDIPPTTWGDTYALAWIGSHYVLKIRKNNSGRYRDKHLISIHTFYDNYNGKATINPDPITSRWHHCHYTEDRNNLKELFQ